MAATNDKSKLSKSVGPNRTECEISSPRLSEADWRRRHEQAQTKMA
jgi:hypothetical protein